MEDEVGPEHPRDRPRRPEAGGQRRLASGVGGHEGQRRDDPGGEIEERVADMPHAVFDVVAEEPQKPHVAEEVHDAAMHEDAGQERQPDRDRRRAQARHRHGELLPLNGDLADARLGDDVAAGEDLRRHLAVGERDVVVLPHPLEHDEHKHVENDQRDRDQRKERPIGVVVGDGEDHAWAPGSGRKSSGSPDPHFVNRWIIRWR